MKALSCEPELTMGLEILAYLHYSGNVHIDEVNAGEESRFEATDQILCGRVDQAGEWRPVDSGSVRAW